MIKEREAPMAGDERAVTVFESGNPALIAVVKSILDDAEILHSIQGENVQNLFGFGSIGTGFNLLTGPIRVQVMPKDAEEARVLLADVAESDDSFEEDPE
jgi:hypothetical protein